MVVEEGEAGVEESGRQGFREEVEDVGAGVGLGFFVG